MNLENLNNSENLNSLGSESEPKSENNLLGALSKCLTFAPLILEQFTGQKVPQMTGTVVEIQQSINQLALNVQTVVNNQNKIWQKLTNLENNANQKLVNLTKQIDTISTVKLTHERERKQIEYNPKKHLENNQEY